MAEINRKAQLVEIGKIEMADCEMPTCRFGDVVVKVEYCGVCGSDVHFYRFGKIGKKEAPFPFILGHECSGVIVEIGEGINTLKVGDRVALEPGVPCGYCEMCRKGKYNLCPDMKFMAAPPYDGALRKYLAHPADMCFKLPDEVSFQDGALLEPLAVGMHAARRGEVTLGKTVCILGGGTIGLMTLLSCKALGASKIIVSDLFENRRASALAFGAAAVIDPKAQDMDRVVMELTDGQGCDIVFEIAGSPYTMADTWRYVKRGGCIVVVGNISADTVFPFLEISRKEVDIRPVFRYRNLYPTLIKAVSDGVIDLSGINPKEFDFKHSDEAFRYTVENAQEVIKTLIKVSD
jgi:L-iditol 2-dehydrogenase